MMKLTKGLENIHSIIDRHEAEWRKEQGEPVEELNAITLEETVRRRLADNNKNSKGRFSADRFLGASTKTKTKEPEQNNKTEGGVEVVSVIKQDENKNHSWLYNEVVKAVNNAAGENENVKVVAVFVPVVQNGKEFEDLPVDNVITTQPVNEEEEIKFEEKDLLKPEQTEQENEPAEAAEEDFNLVPEGQDEPDAELADAFQTMEEKLDETLQEQDEQQEPEIPEAVEIEEPQILPHENIETLHLANKVKEPEVIEEVIEDFEEPLETETEEAEKIDELPLPPLPDELEDDEVFDETKFSNPVEAVQLIEENEENDENIISDDEDGFTFEDAVETKEEEKEEDVIP